MSFGCLARSYWSMPACRRIRRDRRSTSSRSRADGATIDLLARRQLAARRCGTQRPAARRLARAPAADRLRRARRVLRVEPRRVGRKAGRAARCRGRTSARRSGRLRARERSAPTVRALAVLARLVLAERRRAVRGDGRDDARALAADAGAEPPGEDVVAAARARGRTAASTGSRPRGSTPSARRCRRPRTPRRSGRAARARHRPAPARVVDADGSPPPASRGPVGARCSPRRRSSRAARPTSLACQRSTSQRISTARWRGGRCWSAATKASLIDSRSTTVSAGSGVGSIHVTSERSLRFSMAGAPPARGPSAARAARGP